MGGPGIFFPSVSKKEEACLWNSLNCIHHTKKKKDSELRNFKDDLGPSHSEHLSVLPMCSFIPRCCTLVGHPFRHSGQYLLAFPQRKILTFVSVLFLNMFTASWISPPMGALITSYFIHLLSLSSTRSKGPCGQEVELFLITWLSHMAGI